MDTTHISPIKKDSKLIIAKIGIDRLLSEGLKTDLDCEISDSFKCVNFDPIDEDRVHHVHVSRSNGSYTDLEVHFGFFAFEEGNSNVFTSQEIYLGGHGKKLQFICPLTDGDYLPCKELYLRADFPLFGSARALKIG